MNDAQWADFRGIKATGIGNASQTFATNSDLSVLIATHGSGKEAGSQTVFHVTGSHSTNIADTDCCHSASPPAPEVTSSGEILSREPVCRCVIEERFKGPQE